MGCGNFAASKVLRSLSVAARSSQQQRTLRCIWTTLRCTLTERGGVVVRLYLGCWRWEQVEQSWALDEHVGFEAAASDLDSVVHRRLGDRPRVSIRLCTLLVSYIYRTWLAAPQVVGRPSEPPYLAHRS